MNDPDDGLLLPDDPIERAKVLGRTREEHRPEYLRVRRGEFRDWLTRPARRNGGLPNNELTPPPGPDEPASGGVSSTGDVAPPALESHEP